jgi:hypothetical protein
MGQLLLLGVVVLASVFAVFWLDGRMAPLRTKRGLEANEPLEASSKCVLRTVAGGLASVAHLGFRKAFRSGWFPATAEIRVVVARAKSRSRR